jgi:hypothetical protein
VIHSARKDGTEYYEYVLSTHDDLLCISTNPMQILTCLDQHFMLKPGSICPPTHYLGAQLTEYHFSEEPEKIQF